MAAQASGLWKTKHAPPQSLQPSPTQRLLPDATSTSKGKTSLPPQTKTTAASLDYTHSPQKQCHSSTASTHLDHSSISPADSSSTSHSFNACRRWYRLRYEIRLNPLSRLQLSPGIQIPNKASSKTYIIPSLFSSTLRDSIASIPQQSCLHNNRSSCDRADLKTPCLQD